MNSKNIAKALKARIDDWCKNIEDKSIVDLIQTNAIITGGAIVSMLQGEEPNDYDIYFKTKESCQKIAEYYAVEWNKSHPNTAQVRIEEKGERIKCFIGTGRGDGATKDDEESAIDDETEPDVQETAEEKKQEKPKYRPRYFTTNAISLSDKIQLVIRFFGSVDEIHTNYDFIHCTCSYDYSENKINLPARALEAIINKELYYVGSKYPLCSVIRARKFITRGWTINAGQYLKMILQLNKLDLLDLEVFADQLVGVDSAYFNDAINAIRARQEKEPDFKIDNTYLFEVINRIF